MARLLPALVKPSRAASPRVLVFPRRPTDPDLGLVKLPMPVTAAYRPGAPSRATHRCSIRPRLRGLSSSIPDHPLRGTDPAGNARSRQLPDRSSILGRPSNGISTRTLACQDLRSHSWLIRAAAGRLPGQLCGRPSRCISPDPQQVMIIWQARPLVAPHHHDRRIRNISSLPL